MLELRRVGARFSDQENQPNSANGATELRTALFTTDLNANRFCWTRLTFVFDAFCFLGLTFFVCFAIMLFCFFLQDFGANFDDCANRASLKMQGLKEN